MFEVLEEGDRVSSSSLLSACKRAKWNIPEVGKLPGASKKRARQKTTPSVTVLIIRLDMAGNLTEESES